MADLDNTYELRLDVIEALHTNYALQQRIKHLRKRLSNPRTPMARQLQTELAAVEGVKTRVAAIIEEHFAKMTGKLEAKFLPEARDEARRIPCRCPGVFDVRDCKNACRLYACCGGYVNEGHMSDCPGARPEIVHGR